MSREDVIKGVWSKRSTWSCRLHSWVGMKHRINPHWSTGCQEVTAAIDQHEWWVWTYHLGVLNLFEEEGDMENKPAALGDHNDRTTSLFDCLGHVATPDEKEEKHKPDSEQSLNRWLLHLERNLPKVAKAVSAIANQAEVDWCLLEQYKEQQNGFKLELYDISWSLLTMDGDVSKLLDHEAMISRAIFDVCLKIRQLLHTPIHIVHRAPTQDWRANIYWEHNGLAKVLRAVWDFSPFQNSAHWHWEASLSAAVTEGRPSPACHWRAIRIMQKS